jgi:hypothetical protein
MTSGNFFSIVSFTENLSGKALLLFFIGKRKKRLPIKNSSIFLISTAFRGCVSSAGAMGSLNFDHHSI